MLEHFCDLKKKLQKKKETPYQVAADSPSPWQPLLCFLSLWIYLFWNSAGMNICVQVFSVDVIFQFSWVYI